MVASDHEKEKNTSHGLKLLQINSDLELKEEIFPQKVEKQDTEVATKCDQRRHSRLRTWESHAAKEAMDFTKFTRVLPKARKKPSQRYNKHQRRHHRSYEQKLKW